MLLSAIWIKDWEKMGLKHRLPMDRVIHASFKSCELQNSTDVSLLNGKERGASDIS